MASILLHGNKHHVTPKPTVGSFIPPSWLDMVEVTVSELVDELDESLPRAGKANPQQAVQKSLCSAQGRHQSPQEPGCSLSTHLHMGLLGSPVNRVELACHMKLVGHLGAKTVQACREYGDSKRQKSKQSIHFGMKWGNCQEQLHRQLVQQHKVSQGRLKNLSNRPRLRDRLCYVTLNESLLF